MLRSIAALPVMGISNTLECAAMRLEARGRPDRAAPILRDARAFAQLWIRERDARSSESDSEWYPSFRALAGRRESSWTLPMRTQASALAIVASKSLARRRLR